jgi:chemotaxis regulatin CheY-phosphate phosphatase CheZ
MLKEQTLSDKIEQNSDEVMEEFELQECFREWLYAEDVKDFIKKLKEETLKISGKTALGQNRLPGIMMAEFEQIIDKLAGEKLI